MKKSNKRYRAFISYSHADLRWARKIHSALESFRMPRGIELPASSDSKRSLGRFFRDDDELAGSSDLGAALEGAIDDSEALIVICSPAAAASKWVSKEVVRFKSSREPRPVFAVIVDGEPNASERDRPTDECFPLPLRRKVSVDGQVTEDREEPIAPSLKTESLSKVTARLAAGLLDIPFDDLWRREVRRRRRRLAVYSVVFGAFAVASSFLLVQWLAERHAARVQERDSRLETTTQLLATGNSSPAFQELSDLLVDFPRDTLTIGISERILGWTRTPSETLSELEGPLIFRVGDQLYLKSLQGDIAPIQAGVPRRRMGFSDGRMLLFYSDRVVAMNHLTGQAIAEIETPDHQWAGHGFMAPDGTIVVAGRRLGISNGTYWHSLYALSRSGEASLFRPLDHPSGDRVWESRYVDTVRLAPGCRTIAIPEFVSGADPAPASDRYFYVEVADGLQFGGAGGPPSSQDIPLMAGLITERIPYLSPQRSPESFGCSMPVYDTDTNFDLTGPEGLVPWLDTAYSPSVPSDWSEVEPVPADFERGFQAGQWRNRPAAPMSESPCFGQDECRVVAGPWLGESVRHFGYDSIGLVTTTMPTAGSLVGPHTDEFAERPVHTYHVQHNAGIESVWCRRDSDTSFGCLTTRAGMEFTGSWSDIDLRSRSGRFIFFNSGEFRPFKIFDMVSMREAHPEGHSLTIPIGSATFSDTPDDRLFVIREGRIYVFEQGADGRFEDRSSSLPWNGIVAEDAERIVGITALPEGDLIVIREDGLASRIDWRSGQLHWTFEVTGIGPITSFRRSPNGRAVLAIGDFGMRLIQADDGLPISGVLIPPYVFDPENDASACTDSFDRPRVGRITDALSDVHVTDDDRVIVRCGTRRYSWRSRPWTGTHIARLETLRSEGDLDAR